MFFPSGRLSHFSGRRRIEDVIERYINLPEHDRGGSNMNKEFLIRTIKKLKCDSDMAAQLSNPGMVSSNSKMEELQQEINTYQQQLQTLEKRLRFLESDPTNAAAFMSLPELESYETFFLESLARVSDKKKYLLGNHLPAYDSSSMASLPMYLQPQQEGMPNAYSYDLVQWAHQDGSAIHDQSMLLSSNSRLPLSGDHGIFEPISVHMEPNVGGDTWQQAYASADLFTSLIPSAPIIQTSLTAELPSVEGAVSGPHVPAEDGACGGGWIEDNSAPGNVG